VLLYGISVARHRCEFTEGRWKLAQHPSIPRWAGMVLTCQHPEALPGTWYGAVGDIPPRTPFVAGSAGAVAIILSGGLRQYPDRSMSRKLHWQGVWERRRVALSPWDSRDRMGLKPT